MVYKKKQRTLLLHIASYCHPLVLDVLVIEASTRISKSPVTFTLFTSEASILLPDMLSASLATPGKGREWCRQLWRCQRFYSSNFWKICLLEQLDTISITWSCTSSWYGLKVGDRMESSHLVRLGCKIKEKSKTFRISSHFWSPKWRNAKETVFIPDADRMWEVRWQAFILLHHNMLQFISLHLSWSELRVVQRPAFSISSCEKIIRSAVRNANLSSKSGTVEPPAASIKNEEHGRKISSDRISRYSTGTCWTTCGFPCETRSIFTGTQGGRPSVIWKSRLCRKYDWWGDIFQDKKLGHPSFPSKSAKFNVIFRLKHQRAGHRMSHT